MKNLKVVEKENLLVTYFIKGKVYRKFKLSIDVIYDDNDGVLISTTTYNDIKVLLLTNLPDISPEQMEAKFTAKTKDNKLFVGIPSDVNIELDTFQQRRLKMIALDIN